MAADEMMAVDPELLLGIAEDVRYLRLMVAELEPLLPLLAVLRGNGQVDAVAAAGMRRAFRKGRRP